MYITVFGTWASKGGDQIIKGVKDHFWTPCAACVLVSSATLSPQPRTAAVVVSLPPRGLSPDSQYFGLTWWSLFSLFSFLFFPNMPIFQLGKNSCFLKYIYIIHIT